MQPSLAQFAEIWTLATKYSADRAHVLVHGICITHKMNSEISRFVESVRRDSALSAAYLEGLMNPIDHLKPRTVTSVQSKPKVGVCDEANSRKPKGKNVQSGKLKSSSTGHGKQADPIKHSASLPKAKTQVGRQKADKECKIIGNLPIYFTKSKRLLDLLEQVSKLMPGECENRSLHCGDCCVCRFFKFKGNERGIIRRKHYSILSKLHDPHGGASAKIKLIRSWIDNLNKNQDSGHKEKMDTDSTVTSVPSNFNGSHSVNSDLGSAYGTTSDVPKEQRPSRRQRRVRKQMDVMKLRAKSDLVELELRNKKSSALEAADAAIEGGEWSKSHAEKVLAELVDCKLKKRALDRDLHKSKKRVKPS